MEGDSGRAAEAAVAVDTANTADPIGRRVVTGPATAVAPGRRRRGWAPGRFFRPRVHADPYRPHHCAFGDAPFGDRHLRLECADHQPAPEEQERRARETFAATGS